MSRHKVHGDNRGMSLIELIVVIAIMAVLAGGFLSMIGLLSGKQARQAAQDITSSVEKNRVVSMSRSSGAASDVTAADVYVRITRKDRNIVIEQYVKGTVTDSVTVRGNRISHFYVYTAAGGNSAVTDKAEKTELDENGIILAFDRATGAFLPASAEQGTYIKKLEICEGARTCFVSMVPATGRIEQGN